MPDSDEDGMRLVTVGGKSVRASSLALELAISQITAAARPALGCKVSPRLAQKGCELVVTLVREVRCLVAGFGDDGSTLTKRSSAAALTQDVSVAPFLGDGLASSHLNRRQMETAGCRRSAAPVCFELT